MRNSKESTPTSESNKSILIAAAVVIAPVVFLGFVMKNTATALVEAMMFGFGEYIITGESIIAPLYFMGLAVVGLFKAFSETYHCVQEKVFHSANVSCDPLITDAVNPPRQSFVDKYHQGNKENAGGNLGVLRT